MLWFLISQRNKKPKWVFMNSKLSSLTLPMASALYLFTNKTKGTTQVWCKSKNFYLISRKLVLKNSFILFTYVRTHWKLRQVLYDSQSKFARFASAMKKSKQISVFQNKNNKQHWPYQRNDIGHYAVNSLILFRVSIWSIRILLNSYMFDQVKN